MLKKYITDIYIYLRCVLLRKKLHFRVKDDISTINYILKTGVSVSRYGDGEFLLMENLKIGFQKGDPALARRLKYILQNPILNHISCLPYCMFYQKNIRRVSVRFWRSVFLQYYKMLDKLCVKSVYFDTNFTRFYIIYNDKSRTPLLVTKMQQLWENKKVCIVEGDSTRLGVGNDFLNHAKEIKRIICPSTNAFSKYDDILSAITSHVSKDTLVLCALGPTATVLAYDLTIAGYRAIDIGHADIEYMWYKMGANDKCPIPNKAVNEVGIVHVEASTDKDYLQQIIAKIE